MPASPLSVFVAATVLLAACTPAAGPSDEGAEAPTAPSTPLPSTRMPVPLDPPAPGTPGGLADDATPVDEAKFSETSTQGAAQIVQTYHALIESGRAGEAWALWSNGGRASGKSRSDFVDDFARYQEYHAQVGAPGRIEGAAGSLYVTVPVQVYGRRAGGAPFDRLGTVTLRRSNDVPGATPEQRKWRIVRYDLGDPASPS